MPMATARSAAQGDRPIAGMPTLFAVGVLLAIGPPAHAAGADGSYSIGDAQRGKLLIERYHCGRCHTIPGVAAARGKLVAPLARFGLRSYIAGTVPNDPQHLARWIQDPRSIDPSTSMPDMGVSPADARDIASYLGTLR